MATLSCAPGAELDALQRDSFNYFAHEANLENGLVNDKTAPNWPSSIAATGLALTAYPVAVERGFMTRSAALARTLATLRFFAGSPQGPEPDATGYQGFYYHFLDLKTGRRAWQSELSTVDTAFLIAGMLTTAAYFNLQTTDESEVRSLVDGLYRRVNWHWAQNGESTLTHGWNPEHGFLPYRWQGYDEGLLLYVLALGSPSFPLSTDGFAAWCATYQWHSAYGYDYLYAGSLFTHQLSHIWIDFRGIRDRYMHDKGLDYFENSRRATQVQRAYAIANPHAFKGYGPCCWGITASTGPGPATLQVDGIERQFFGYISRGVPLGPDDGTIAPWTVVASLPFAPDIVLPAIAHFIQDMQLQRPNLYGFKSTFNATFPGHYVNPCGWVSSWHYGINQGPIVLMIENYRSELLWTLTKQSPHVTRGLHRAGFTGGWL